MAVISVLVPVYNVEAYLEECLESLLGQTFSDIEIICVDDGSTDKSGEILDRYALRDFRVKVVHKKNTGYGNSMNVALAHANGEYIAILESDDFAEPDMLRLLYETAKAQDAEVVKGSYYNFRDGVDTLSDRLDRYEKGKVLNSSECPLILDLADTIWSCLYKQSFLTKYDIRFRETEGASYQDISFALQVWLQAERVCFMEQGIIHYRRDNPGSSMNNPYKVFCVFDEYGWLEEKFQVFFQKNPLLEKYFVAVKYRDYFNHYYRVGVQYQYALLCRLAEAFQEDLQKGRVEKPAFFPRIWEQLTELEDDLNSFFRKTAKKTGDTRLELCRFENEEVYAKAFFDKLREYPQVLVYGAGKIGQMMAKSIMEHGCHVDSFIVTKRSEQDNGYMGIPVHEAAEVTDLTETCAVVIAVAERTQYELYQNLAGYGFRNIFRVDRIIRGICQS